MTDRPRAVLTALTLACTLLPPAASRADAQADARGATTATAQTPVLPAARARPPAPRPAARPAVPAQPVAQRPPVRPAANPAPMPASTRPLASNGETWAQISAETVNGGEPKLPIGRGHRGPSVLRVQVLLDRALFSPGMLDGNWGKNTQNAVYWLQAREGLPATGTVDAATYAKLERIAGAPAELVRRHTLTADEVRGPFVAIPANIYEHARLRCSCYETLAEKLTEAFHTRLDLLQKLNPGVDLDQVQAGDVLNVPAVRDPNVPPAGEVRALVISGTDNYLQALDGNGRILYHFAATLGSTFDPSPEGDFRVVSVHENPWWRYQPRLLAHVDDWKPEAMIPPGPNNAVGRVWMTLSAPHYGIHGTRSPETIGYAQSAGCVRLTNWDVMFLSKRIPPGTPVQFRGTRTRPQPAAAAAAQPDSAARVLGVRADSARADTARAARPDSAKPPAPRDSAAAPAPPDSTKRDTAAAAPKPAPAAPPTPAPSPPAPPAKPDSAGTRS